MNDSNHDASADSETYGFQQPETSKKPDSETSANLVPTSSLKPIAPENPPTHHDAAPVVARAQLPADRKLWTPAEIWVENRRFRDQRLYHWAWIGLNVLGVIVTLATYLLFWAFLMSVTPWTVFGLLQRSLFAGAAVFGLFWFERKSAGEYLDPVKLQDEEKPALVAEIARIAGYSTEVHEETFALRHRFSTLAHLILAAPALFAFAKKIGQRSKTLKEMSTVEVAAVLKLLYQRDRKVTFDELLKEFPKGHFLRALPALFCFHFVQLRLTTPAGLSMEQETHREWEALNL